MRAKKDLGQHFLVSSRVVDSILDTCRDASADSAAVLEIGPGRGAITTGLLGLGKPFFAIEMDYTLAASLSDEFPTARITLGDARELDLNHVAAETGLSPWLVAGNLPYNAGTEILRRVLSAPSACCGCIAMLQREVAHKFCGSPVGEGYGPLSVWTSAWWDSEILFAVPPGAFSPPPKVTSAVCRFVPRNPAALPASDIAPYWRFLRAAFAQPRKTLVSNLAGVAGGKASSLDALERAGAGPLARPSQVPAERYETLFALLRGILP